MISVVMAVYNGEKFILKQLESLYKQTKQIDELIVIDDCSTDNSVSIIKKYIKDNEIKNWHIFYNNKNLGYIQTFKKAISKTNGEYIFLCDQDDIWLDNKIELVTKIFEENQKIKSLCTSFMKIDDNDNEILDKFKRPFSANHGLIRKNIYKNEIKKIDLNTILTFNISPGCTCAFRSNIKKEIINSKINIPHDWMINIISAIGDGTYFYNKELIKYRIHSGNTLGLKRKYKITDRANICRNEIAAREEIKSYLIKRNFTNSTCLKYLDNLILFHKKRLENLQGKKIISSFVWMIKSINKNGLYDNFAIDAFAIIKGEK